MHTSENTPPPCTTTSSRRRSDLERFEAQLAEWTALIGQYRAAARRADARARPGLDRITDDLQLLRNEAGVQVMRLKGSGDVEWEQEKSQVERAWQVVRSAFQRAGTAF
jgi:hypothetical protein